MISGIFHEGSGLGNQLFRYVAARVRATDTGDSFGMVNPHLFKGSSFMTLDMGLPYGWGDDAPLFQEKKVTENGVDIRGYDPEINFFNHGVMDGEFQDERYFNHRINEVREWLHVEPIEFKKRTCVIGFRGGEYTLFPDLFLTKDYWDKAIHEMYKIYDGWNFEVHTDDPITAAQFFPKYKIIHDIGLNWRSIRYAEYMIIANSSFYILPALVNQNAKKIIAPRYWARRNTKTWALPQNYYSKFTYI